MSTTNGPKRFYKTAAAVVRGDGHAIALDGRPVRTPLKAVVVLPSLPLAEAIAGEWNAQGERVDFRTMPLMSFASTAIDRVMPRRNEVVAEIVAYAGTDLLCYRADAPPALIERQAALWQPMLDWLDEVHGARLEFTSGVIHCEQAPAALEAVREVVDGQDDFRLAALHLLTAGTGSVVLGLGVAEGVLDAAEAAAASQLDELFQAEQWGDDPQAAARRGRIARELADAERFLKLLAAA